MEQEEENLELEKEGSEENDEEEGPSVYNKEGGEAEPDNEADLETYRNSYYTMSDDQL